MLLGLFLLAGCGGRGVELAPVEGVVLFDGKPIDGAGVMFQPVGGGRPAIGTTDSEGKFRLSTFDPGDGAIVGDHLVAVSKAESGGVPMENGLESTIKMSAKFFLPARYAAPKQSGLTATVKQGNMPVRLELHSSP
jgi:hypothetical protein